RHCAAARARAQSGAGGAPAPRRPARGGASRRDRVPGDPLGRRRLCDRAARSEAGRLAAVGEPLRQAVGPERADGVRGPRRRPASAATTARGRSCPLGARLSRRPRPERPLRARDAASRPGGAVTIPGPPEVACEIAAALDRSGLRCRRVQLVSPLGERKGIRFAYRVDTEDGRTVKLRHFGAAEPAREHVALRAELDEAFAPVLGRDGAVVFEAWVAGVPLDDADPEERAGEAGALLGRLHATPMRASLGTTCDTRRWRSAAHSDLEILRRAGTLSAAEAAALGAALAALDPEAARVALIHKDFCAENMLVDGGGRLHLIDNEQLEVGPAGFDLGRTFHRWPMSRAAWTRFIAGYRACAPADPGATGFWRIVAALVGARVFLQRIPERLDASLELLRRLAAGRDLEHADAR